MNTNELDQTELQVLACIDIDSVTIDQICIRSKLGANLVSAALLNLELKDKVTSHLGGYIRI
jgi:predicted Rossmann fold nucleotide-binding protein DprA/Smf involved in DNA uptake